VEQRRRRHKLWPGLTAEPICSRPFFFISSSPRLQPCIMQ
jgi:hypothetical protein